MMIGMGLGLLLLVGLLVVVPLMLLGGGTMLFQNRQWGRSQASSARPVTDLGSPRELLQSRLARGEISVAEYREIRAEMNEGKDA